MPTKRELSFIITQCYY